MLMGMYLTMGRLTGLVALVAARVWEGVKRDRET